MRVPAITWVVPAIVFVAVSAACRSDRVAEPPGQQGESVIQAAAPPPLAQSAASPQGTYVPVTAYDIKRDPAADLRQAIAQAGRTHKRILLEVGGEWCVWCHIMDAYFDQNPGLLEDREQKFITVKINYSEENKNETFLSNYPKVPGYPHIFVLDSDGTLLHSQNTGELESGKSYDLAKFSEFLNRWAA